MKFIVLSLFLVAHEVLALSIVSDLDDTLKVTNVRSPLQAARNAVSSTKAYDPMPLLMQEMAQYTNDLYVVSASPKILNKFIQKFYDANNLVVKQTFTRGVRDLRDKKEFKIRSINTIFEQSSDDLILLGDNAEVDPEIYANFNQKFANRVVAIYIHRVYPDEVNRPGQFTYFTAFDIAAQEFLAGRMTFEQVRTIAQEIITETQMDKIIPHFAYCPTDGDEFNKLPLGRLSVLALPVKTKIIGYCKIRNRVRSENDID